MSSIGHSENESADRGPRKDDHLVEPFYSGLGLESEGADVIHGEPAATHDAHGGRWFGRLLAFLRGA